MAYALANAYGPEQGPRDFTEGAVEIASKYSVDGLRWHYGTKLVTLNPGKIPITIHSKLQTGTNSLISCRSLQQKCTKTS